MELTIWRWLPSGGKNVTGCHCHDAIGDLKMVRSHLCGWLVGSVMTEAISRSGTSVTAMSFVAALTSATNALILI